MRILKPEFISHGKHAVYSVDFQPGQRQGVRRLATAGGGSFPCCVQFSLVYDLLTSYMFASYIPRFISQVMGYRCVEGRRRFFGC